MIQQLPNIMPDMMIVFAMPVLTHCPVFTDHTDKDQLAQMQTCLTHILEPLIAQKDTFCFGYYKELNEQMKNHYLSTANDDNNINVRLWTLCDLAMTVLVSKTINFEMRNFPTEPRIPAMYFKRMDDSIDNKKNYLPLDMQVPKKLSPTTVLEDQQAQAANTRQKRRLKGAANNQTAFPEFDVEPTEEMKSSYIDAMPAAASETRIQLPGMEEDSDEDREPSSKRSRNSTKDNN
ncbi:sister chromatid cohesion protein PDS5 homolog B-like isoform X2 [Nilaparvata lugens]|uniref:sister chromatid cohesion protein PDS5 homolog B-like isoform X2 n=1 Tax=Nilaparvata lugens TaxID=108931 RepID=UPI00193DE56E|nr:sister chromatid cohesion protein PDS5 homolog B-like isoform X2 [Nilaparvata lugens]